MPSTPCPAPLSELACDVLEERYLREGEAGIEALTRRVARALAQAEDPAQRDFWAGEFLAAQAAGFIPAGRILANAGWPGPATLINCFVQPASVGSGDAGITEAIALARTTLQMGGGVGYDFSPLPPRDSGEGAAGVVAAIRRFDRACDTWARPDGRRCAQMAVLRITHPDVLDFIHAKDAGGLANFNLSLAIDDGFMRALEAGAEIDLLHPSPPAGAAARRDGQHLYQRLPAARIWQAFTNRAAMGEPGALFIDSINRDNNLHYCETIRATNPCGEQPLPVFGGCDLGSMNLARFVTTPFSPGARFDFAGLGRSVRVAVRMLDNVLDLTRWPLAAQAAEAQSKRRVGLGVTGLADALLMLGLGYHTPSGRTMAERIIRSLRDQAYLASVRLAIERGAFPLLDRQAYLGGEGFATRLPPRIRQLIAAHGLRNSHLLAIAPAGSISAALGGNVANGIEPVFDWRYTRRRRCAGGEMRDYVVENFSWRRFIDQGGDPHALPAHFVTAQEMSAADQLAMVAALAPFIDAGISKTVNLPPDVKPGVVDALYREAWRAGLKGLTSFSPGSAFGAVLIPASQQTGVP